MILVQISLSPNGIPRRPSRNQEPRIWVDLLADERVPTVPTEDRGSSSDPPSTLDLACGLTDAWMAGMICNQIFNRLSVTTLDLRQVCVVTAGVQQDDEKGRESCTDLLARMRHTQALMQSGSMRMNQKTQRDLCSRSGRDTSEHSDTTI